MSHATQLSDNLMSILLLLRARKTENRSCVGGRQGLSLFDGKGLPIPRIAPSLSRQGGQDTYRRSLQLALPAIRPAENSSCKVFFRQGRPSRANAALRTL